MLSDLKLSLGNQNCWLKWDKVGGLGWHDANTAV